MPPTTRLTPAALPLLAAALAVAGPTELAGQSRPVPDSLMHEVPMVFYASFGTAGDQFQRLDRTLLAEGLTPIPANAVSGGLGFWVGPPDPMAGRAALALEANFLDWRTHAAADGRSAHLWGGDAMMSVGVPLVSGRTTVYPLVGWGVRLHYLDVTRGSGQPSGSAAPPTVFARALHQDSHIKGLQRGFAHLGVGAHSVLPAGRGVGAITVGARLGYVLGGRQQDAWMIGRDTIPGPKDPTAGMYARLLVGVSYCYRYAPRNEDPWLTPPPRPRLLCPSLGARQSRPIPRASALPGCARHSSPTAEPFACGAREVS